LLTFFHYNTDMKRILITLTLLTQLSFSATPEQVEQYISVSNAEEELLELQSQFSRMQNAINAKDNNASEASNYDMQMLTIRFKDYLKKHLSDDEMTKVLENYKNVVLLRFVAASSEAQKHDQNETFSYLKKLKNDPESAVRVDLVNKISKAAYSKDAMAVMFDELVKPLMLNGIGGQKINDKMLKPMKEKYLKMMIEAANIETLFASRDFTIEELEELLKISKNSATDHEVKAVFGAMAYSLKEYFMSLVNRFNVNKHQNKLITGTNNSK